jgi:hypothetical protein
MSRQYTFSIRLGARCVLGVARERHRADGNGARSAGVSSVTSGGGSVSPGESTFRALFLEPDRTLDVGDVSAQGVIGGANATFTVVDCGGVPSIP